MRLCSKKSYFLLIYLLTKNVFTVYLFCRPYWQLSRRIVQFRYLAERGTYTIVMYTKWMSCICWNRFEVWQGECHAKEWMSWTCREKLIKQLSLTGRQRMKGTGRGRREKWISKKKKERYVYKWIGQRCQLAIFIRKRLTIAHH